MTSKKAIGIFIVISFFAGGLVGFAAGGYIGFELTSASFGNRWLYEQATDISNRITILKNAREGRHEETMELTVVAEMSVEQIDHFIKSFEEIVKTEGPKIYGKVLFRKKFDDFQTRLKAQEE